MSAAEPKKRIVSAAPPHSVEAEQSVIGSLLLDNRAWDRVSDILADDFYRREHRLIFNTIASLCSAGKPADVVTVSELIQQSGELEAVGGLSYLASLANNTPSAVNIAAYADIVRKHASARRLRSVAVEVVDGNTSPDTLTRLGNLIAESGQTGGRQRLTPVDLSALVGCDIDPTRYVIAPLLPRGHVTLLSAHGGAGKTMMAETFAAHAATGTSWAGLQTERVRVLFLSLEDPGDLARFRLRRICDAYGLSHADVAEHMTLLDGSTADSVLAAEVADAGVRRLTFTAALAEIETAAEGRSLVVIDNASDAFDGDENNRRLVRAFVRRLAHVARKHDCAVLLLAHVDKAAARYGGAGNTYSGNTAWHNTVRSRLALIEDDGGLCLIQEKLNLGKKIEPVRVEWTDTGVLVPVVQTGTEATERDAQDDADVLAAIQAAIDDGATVHAARQGPYSARSVLETYQALPRALHKDKRRFWAALSRLERVQSIVREKYTDAHRHERARFILRASLPHTPSVGTHAQGARAAPLRVPTMERGKHAVGTHCPHCDGTGCKWCKQQQRADQ